MLRGLAFTHVISDSFVAFEGDKVVSAETIRVHELEHFQHGAKVLQRCAGTDARAEQAGAVVGDDRLGALAAAAVGDPAEVLKDREQLYALAGAVEAISSRFGSGVMLAASSRHNSSGGSIG